MYNALDMSCDSPVIILNRSEGVYNNTREEFDMRTMFLIRKIKCKNGLVVAILLLLTEILTVLSLLQHRFVNRNHRGVDRLLLG